MTHSARFLRTGPGLLTLALACPLAAAQAQARVVPRSADFIVAVVNNELVTQFEVDQRMARAREDAGRSGARLPRRHRTAQGRHWSR